MYRYIEYGTPEKLKQHMYRFSFHVFLPGFPLLVFLVYRAFIVIWRVTNTYNNYDKLSGMTDLSSVYLQTGNFKYRNSGVVNYVRCTGM
jgi:hypothetical protein